MNDYTPTTEEVRAGYSTATYDDAKAEVEFDRWLAEVKAQAWEEGYSTGLIEYANKVTFNPYGYAQHHYRQGEEQ